MLPPFSLLGSIAEGTVLPPAAGEAACGVFRVDEVCVLDTSDKYVRTFFFKR